jgi:hypothetical protein
MKRLFPLILVLLFLAGGAKAQTEEKTHAAYPTGEGDPDTITCRPPQPLPNSRLNGPEVCRKNSAWAQYRRDGMDVAPDGIHDVPLRGDTGITCSAVAIPSGASGPVRMNMKCMDPAPDGTHPVMRSRERFRCNAGMICG